MLAEDQPTIEEILIDYGIADMLYPDTFANLLVALQERDNVMRTDAVEHQIKKMTTKGLDTIIKQY